MYEILTQGHGIEIDEYWNRNSLFNVDSEFRWASRKNQVSEKEVYDDVTWKFENLIRKLEVRHRYDGPNIPKNSEMPINIQSKEIKTQHNPSLGRCYTFSMPEQWKQWGVGSIQIWA